MININEIIKSNIAENYRTDLLLEKLFKESKTEVRIISPLLSIDGSRWFLEQMRDIKIKILTQIPRNLRLSSPASEALVELLKFDNIEIRFFTDNLHAKIYAFDKKDFVFTSGNMTEGGMNSNYEFGIHLQAKYLNPAEVEGNLAQAFQIQWDVLWNELKPTKLDGEAFKKIGEAMASHGENIASEENEILGKVLDDLGAHPVRLRSKSIKEIDNPAPELTSWARDLKPTSKYWTSLDFISTEQYAQAFANTWSDLPEDFKGALKILKNCSDNMLKAEELVILLKVVEERDLYKDCGRGAKLLKAELKKLGVKVELGLDALVEKGHSMNARKLATSVIFIFKQYSQFGNRKYYWGLSENVAKALDTVDWDG